MKIHICLSEILNIPLFKTCFLNTDNHLKYPTHFHKFKWLFCTEKSVLNVSTKLVAKIYLRKF